MKEGVLVLSKDIQKVLYYNQTIRNIFDSGSEQSLQIDEVNNPKFLPTRISETYNSQGILDSKED